MKPNAKKPLLILTGPTAVGKTRLSIELAKAVGGAILSADSMQVYRGMDIGTAKIKPEEMQGIPHYLIDILDPSEEFNVTRFQSLAKEAIVECHQKGLIPILTGGTGFYIQAVLYDIDFTKEDADMTYRQELEALAAEKGEDCLHDMLAAVDPESAAAIHKNNIKRVIRALEYYKKSGEPISAHNAKERERKSPYDFKYFVLTDDRQKLYERIDRRVDQMIDEGLPAEAKWLYETGIPESATSMQGIGYKQWIPYFKGEIPYEEAVRILKRDTRHFAKRQLTWFKRERDVIWIDRREFADDEEAILRFMLEQTGWPYRK